MPPGRAMAKSMRAPGTSCTWPVAKRWPSSTNWLAVSCTASGRGTRVPLFSRTSSPRRTPRRRPRTFSSYTSGRRPPAVMSPWLVKLSEASSPALISTAVW